MKTDKSIYSALIVFMAIFASAPTLILTGIFSRNISFSKQVETEAVNGIVTVSGLIFAFQPTYFKRPREQRSRLMYLIIFLTEGLMLGLTGSSYVNDILNLGYLTVNTLFVASASLFYNISMTGFFVLVELWLQP